MIAHRIVLYFFFQATLYDFFFTHISFLFPFFFCFSSFVVDDEGWKKKYVHIYVKETKWMHVTVHMRTTLESTNLDEKTFVASWILKLPGKHLISVLFVDVMLKGRKKKNWILWHWNSFTFLTSCLGVMLALVVFVMK